MAYNYNDEKMYFITNSANEDVSTSMLGTVDLQTGKFKSVVADLGFHGFVLGYSYEVYTTAISMANGSHELFFGYQHDINLVKKGKNKHKSVRIL